MNRKIGMIGSLVNALTVLGFAVFLLTGFKFGYYFICIFLSISFVCMIAAFDAECTEENKVAGKVSMMFAAIYATYIMLVYFTQCTTVRNETLTGDVLKILDYSNLSLMFNIDLLGYGIMALSTFFIGLTIRVNNKKDKALKFLLLVHGIFFLSCLIMPMTGMFVGSGCSTSNGGIMALEVWCIYFFPIGILSWLHFKQG